MAKNEETSRKIGSIAAKLLRDPKTPKSVKSIAALVLKHRPDRKKTKKKKNSHHRRMTAW
jgi:hypothetical protein